MKKILAVMVLLLGLSVFIKGIQAAPVVNVPGNLSYEQEITLDEVLGTRVCLIDNFGILYYLEIGNGKITGIADHPLCDSSFKVVGGYEGIGFRIHLRGSHGDCVNYLYEGAVSNFDTKTAMGKWRNSRKGGKGWFTLAPYTGDNQVVSDKSAAGSGMPGIFSDKETPVCRKSVNAQISSYDDDDDDDSILGVFGPTILLKDNFGIIYDLTLFDEGTDTGRVAGVITHVCCGTYTTKDDLSYSYHDDKHLEIYLNKDINKELCNDLPNQICVDYKCFANLIGTSTLSGGWENIRRNQASRSSHIYSTGAFTLTAFESPGGVYGKVTDSATGEGISGCSIKLKDKETSVETATSDSNGDYKLQHVWVGKEYTLVVSANDYGEQSLSCKLEKADKDRGKEFNFSLKESIPPTVGATSPRDGKTEIPLTAVITATFSEPMDSSTITDTTFLLSSKEGLRKKSKGSRVKRRKSVTGVVTYNDAKQMATFTPESKLSYNSTYEAVITTGVKDTAGNNMQSSYKWSFSTAHNEAPQVDAGVDQNINVGALASLDATVTDDGLPKDGTLTTLWTQQSGAGTVTFGNASAVDTTASFSTSGVYVLELKADDGGLSATDTVTINVNSAPLVDAGADRIVDFGKTESLDGTVTDDGLPIPPGKLTTTWTQLSGTGTVSFGNANAVDTTATFSASGDYVLELRADDGGLAAADTVTVTVNAVTYTLTLDAAGVQGDASVKINDTSIESLLLNDGAGYLGNSITFDLSLLRNGENTLSITAPFSSGSDTYDDIQVTKIKLVKTNEDKVVLADEGTYHIGDQTIAEITDSYNRGIWTDPNPPAFWTELVGKDVVITFSLTLD